MTEDKEKIEIHDEIAEPAAQLHVAPSPHLANNAFTTRWMMLDVIIALMPLMLVAIWIFKWYAVKQVGICVLSCLAFEALFTSWTGKKLTLGDGSALVTGLILGLSLPWSAPWYVGFIGSMIAISLGKVVFGGLGYNIFNPAMVGRAFVMFSFPLALSATMYVKADHVVTALTQATPMTAAKIMGEGTALWPMFIGSTNGSLGETSALACIIGGLYLVIRRTASWEIPFGAIVSLVIFALIGQFIGPDSPLNVLHHLVGGAFLFGAFFIATDPVSSPLTQKGKFWFGFGYGAIVMLLRAYSGYPEGVMFAVLIMNAITPLINKWTIPIPLGGPVPVRK